MDVQSTENLPRNMNIVAQRLSAIRRMEIYFSAFLVVLEGNEYLANGIAFPGGNFETNGPFNIYSNGKTKFCYRHGNWLVYV